MFLRQIKSLFRVTLSLRVLSSVGLGLAVFGLAGASAQTQDTSGNGMLKGTYQFRHLAVQSVDANNNPTDITAVYGSITFDGAGNYTVAATSVDNSVSAGAPQPLKLNGTYAIGSNGVGYLTNPLYPDDPDANINGAVAQGVFTGSSTESQLDQNYLNDIFIAIPTGPPPTNASFTASYQTGLLDFPGATSASTKNALFELIPDGKGGFGQINLSGQAAEDSNPTVTESITGATYSFNSDGSATLTIPTPARSTALFAGTKTLFESADGNFILGWTPAGFDIFFGVKALDIAGTNAAAAGLYFTSALENSPELGGTDSYYGGTSNSGDGNGDGVVHQRLNIPGADSIDYGSDNQIALNADGSTSAFDFVGYLYLFGDAVNGVSQAFVGVGTNGLFSLVVGLHAPVFSGPGVYLNPIGVNNAASFQPITASISPGEDIALYGTGLSSTTTNVQGGQVFPTTSLGGVSVTIDGIPCPLYSVSSTQLNVVVPYEVASNTSGLANIQVTNNGVPSNVVQMYLTDALPGVFSQTQNGIGLAAALHNATGLLVTPDNPAQPGEYIQLYMTGLGTVTPAIPDGAVGPSATLSYSDLFNAGFLAVLFNDYIEGSTENAGNIQYAGLVPTLAGLYQINVQVPSSGLGDGDNVYIEIVTDAADIDQIQIPYGSSSTARPASPAFNAARSRARLRTMRAHRRKTGTSRLDIR